MQRVGLACLEFALAGCGVDTVANALCDRDIGRRCDGNADTRRDGDKVTRCVVVVLTDRGVDNVLGMGRPMVDAVRSN